MKKCSKLDLTKAIHIASKQIEIESNGGRQFVRQTQITKNKKKYDRKRDKLRNIDLSL